jgi:hypothetical protein
MCHAQEDADEEYLLIIKEVFGDIAMDVEDAPLQLVPTPALHSRLDSQADFIQQGI